MAVVSGVGVRAPTANDLIARSEAGALIVENESVHVLPWFGLLATPDSPFFGQAVIQVDVDANGNPVTLDDGDGPITVGRLQDQTFLFSSFSLGAWLYDDPCSCRLSSVASTLEVHHSTAVRDADSINVPGVISITEGVATPDGGSTADDFDTVTGIIGLHLFYAGGAQVTFAYGVPLAQDRFADSEFRTMLTRNY
jgi:hypothetical protein